MEEAPSLTTSTGLSLPQEGGEVDEQQVKKRRGAQAAVAVEQKGDRVSPVFVSDDSGSEDDEEDQQQWALAYEPLSPTAPASKGWTASQGPGAACQDCKYSDDVEGAPPSPDSDGVLVSCTATGIVPPADPEEALVERVAGALMQRRRRAAATKRLRRAQLQKEQRERWAQQWRSCASSVTRSVYR